MENEIDWNLYKEEAAELTNDERTYYMLRLVTEIISKTCFDDNRKKFVILSNSGDITEIRGAKIPEFTDNEKILIYTAMQSVIYGYYPKFVSTEIEDFGSHFDKFLSILRDRSDARHMFAIERINKMLDEHKPKFDRWFK